MYITTANQNKPLSVKVFYFLLNLLYSFGRICQFVFFGFCSWITIDIGNVIEMGGMLFPGFGKRRSMENWCHEGAQKFSPKQLHFLVPSWRGKPVFHGEPVFAKTRPKPWNSKPSISITLVIGRIQYGQLSWTVRNKFLNFQVKVLSTPVIHVSKTTNSYGLACVNAENTHRWEKDHSTAGLQFNKPGADQWRKYNFICI